MRLQDRTQHLDEALELVRRGANADLLGAPDDWGPLEIVALVARTAVRLATATPAGRQACARLTEPLERS